MSFTKIVITGGPCAGKTTGLSYLEQTLTQAGFKVVILNETATELILNGLSASAFCNNYDFEKNIIHLQLEKEKLYEEYCKNLPNKNVVMLCDRGVMDCKSYMTDAEFTRALTELNTNEISLRDNYDAVFHLVSAAKGAEAFYTTANNAARRENAVSEAIASDDRTMNAWIGHPHFRAIDNSTGFEGKMKKLAKEIFSFLGLPKAVEIERKFLIEKPNLNYLDSLPNCKKVNIVQTYLKTQNGIEKRIRQRGIDGSYIYTLTTKTPIDNITRNETEIRIPIRQYLSLINEADNNLHQVIKTRYCLMHKNHYFEIDVYPFANKTAICEIELTQQNDEFILPDFIKCVKEVTGNKQYSNRALAENIPFDLY